MADKLFGVNIAGADFGQNIPGVVDKDYTYQTSVDSYKYYVSKGLKVFRLPFLWERMCNADGTLRTMDIAGLDAMVDAVGKAGGVAILDMHNYGMYNKVALKKDDLTLAATWSALATHFKDNKNVFGYELMNEPHDMPDGAAGWVQIVQRVVTAIRKVDSTHNILVSGYDWQSSDRWQASNANLLITDPKVIYTAHCYFDGDASGQYWWGDATPSVGVDRLQSFVTWLKSNNLKGMITEFGVPFGKDANSKLKTEWFPVLDNFYQEIMKDDVLLGGTYWAGGPWWGDYVTTLEPKNGTDRESMAIVAKYPTVGFSQLFTGGTTSPTPPQATTPAPTSVPPVTANPGVSGNNIPLITFTFADGSKYVFSRVK